MISYSPDSRYTAQKITDKVSNGAYFYSHFSVEKDESLLADNIQALIKKLTTRYALNLTPRQRTYRLNTKKEPIADLIIQKRKEKNGITIFDFYLFITTPETHSYNDEKERTHQKIHKQRVSELKTPMNLQFEREQIALIQSHFMDQEKFKFVLTKPFLKLPIIGVEIELVRLSHSTKSSEKYDSKKSKKGYTWTWRYDEISVAQIKKIYTNNIDLLISNPNKESNIEKIRTFYNILRFASVFKGTRHQLGRLFVDMLRHHKTKTKQDFKKMDYYVELKLNYLPRLNTYADDFTTYMLLRLYAEELNKKLDKTYVEENFNQLMKQYLKHIES